MKSGTSNPKRVSCSREAWATDFGTGIVLSGGLVSRATDLGSENPFIRLKSLGVLGAATQTVLKDARVHTNAGNHSLCFTQPTQTCALSINTRIFLFLP